MRKWKDKGEGVTRAHAGIQFWQINNNFSLVGLDELISVGVRISFTSSKLCILSVDILQKILVHLNLSVLLTKIRLD